MKSVAIGTLWVGLTLLAAWLAGKYDGWITRAHTQEECQAESRRVVPTSFLVVLGVFGTEMLRALRWGLVVGAILFYLDLGQYAAVAILCTLALWVLDCLTSYGITGVRMVYGDLQREAKNQAEHQMTRLEVIAKIAKGGNGEHSEQGERAKLENGEGVGSN